jgi:hypothetical protein
VRAAERSSRHAADGAAAAAAQVHLVRRLCQRFGVPMADEVLQETLAKEVGSLRATACDAHMC